MGIALSDPLKMIAHPLEFVPAEPESAIFDRVQSLLGEHEIERIVVGMPRNMDGSFGTAAEKVRGFVESLRQRTNVPVTTWDERLTSVQANRYLSDAGVRSKNRKKRVDGAAAAVLLQSYLDGISTP